MTAAAEITGRVETFRASSSIAEDVWHGRTAAPDYEWWYFDALSRDRRDALVIIFLSNFIFSPRYNRAAMESRQPTVSTPSVSLFPALAVCLYRDGRPLYRAINEFAADDFQASTTYPEGRIGDNTFRLVETDSGPCYELNIRTALRHRKELCATLVWRVREGDFFTTKEGDISDRSAHCWNMVAPRCDVAGDISLLDEHGERAFELDFQGTGYHDHNRDSRWMPETIAEWQWGRFHFPAATAVFYRYREKDERRHTTSLYLVRENGLALSAPGLTTSGMRRHHFGLRYPTRLRFEAGGDGDGLVMEVRQRRVIDGSFFYLRCLSEAIIHTPDGRVQQATGLTEQLAPRALGSPWLGWLINMRIGRNGRTAFLP